MASPALSLNPVCNVSIFISPQVPAAPTFNQGLILGNSGVIPTTGANSRIRKYANLAAMLTDGFLVTSPEYIAASFYFSQSPAPLFVWIGAQDPAGINGIAVDADASTGYVVGDILTVVQGGASGGTVKVTTIGGGGSVTGVALVTSGTGYSVASDLVTTGGHGTGSLIDISSIGEPDLQAIIACRAAQTAWYAFMVTSAADADHLALAGWAQTATPPALYFFSTSDAAVLANTGGNILATMLAANYNRAFGMYNTTQAGLFPNNIYAAAAAMGEAMGLNTGLNNSYFTMKFKVLTGVGPEPLTQSQVSTLESINCNTYEGYGNSYTWLEQGVVTNGQFVDEVINIDMLASFIQTNVVNLLVGTPSIPLTDPGETQLLQAVSQACQQSSNIGFIATGVWKGVQILNLFPGTSLPGGYLVQAALFATQLPSDRAARKAMPIYVALTEAGSAHSLVVGVYVQR